MNSRKWTALFAAVLCAQLVHAGVRINPPQPLPELQGRTDREKLAILEEYIYGSDPDKKRSAIEELGMLGAVGVPLLLKGFSDELRIRETVALGGKVIERETKFVSEFLLALGRTRDRRIINPMISVAESDDYHDDVRGGAIRVLSSLGCEYGAIPFGRPNVPAPGEEISQKDVLLIMSTLGRLVAAPRAPTSDKIKNQASSALVHIASCMPPDWIQGSSLKKGVSSEWR